MVPEIHSDGVMRFCQLLQTHCFIHKSQDSWLPRFAPAQIQNYTAELGAATTWDQVEDCKMGCKTISIFILFK